MIATIWLLLSPVILLFWLVLIVKEIVELVRATGLGLREASILGRTLLVQIAAGIGFLISLSQDVSTPADFFFVIEVVSTCAASFFLRRLVRLRKPRF